MSWIVLNWQLFLTCFVLCLFSRPDLKIIYPTNQIKKALTDLRMHPLLCVWVRVLTGNDMCVCVFACIGRCVGWWRLGELSIPRERQSLSGCRQSSLLGLTLLPEVKGESSGEWTQLSCHGTHVLCSSMQLLSLYLELPGARRRGQMQAANVKKGTCPCVHLRGRQGPRDCQELGAYGPSI